MQKKSLKDLVYSYPTKSKYGFTDSEQKEIIKNFPNINMEKYYSAMFGNTCMMNDDKEIISYHVDVLKALRCGIENRDLNESEWD